MYKNVSEAFVAIDDPPSVAKKICMDSVSVSLSIVTKKDDSQLNFEDGHAIIRAADHGLLLRVSARDLLTFYGIRALIEGSLWKLAPSSLRTIRWVPERILLCEPATSAAEHKT